MKRSGSQKVLYVVSIFAIIGGVATMLMSIMAFLGGGFIQSLAPAEVASLVAETGLSQIEASGLMIMLGIFALIGAIIGVIKGVLGIRASKDASKIGPARFLAIASLVLSIVGTVMGAINGNIELSGIITDFLSIAFGIFMLWICNNIKEQAITNQAIA